MATVATAREYFETVVEWNEKLRSVHNRIRLLIGEKQPQVQFTRVEQIAGLAVFLASDTASNMQGAALVSDGGWTAQ